MKKSYLILCIVVIGTIICPNIMAQSDNTATNTLSLGMDAVSLLDSKTGTISLKLSPRSAGQSIKQSISDSTARILITSVIESTPRIMSASVSGAIPSGTILKVQAQAPNGNFVGTAGTIGNEVQLLDGAAALPIITGIGTCYSGTGSSDGYALKYTYALSESTSDYGSIRATAGSVVTVTLTLSE